MSDPNDLRNVRNDRVPNSARYNQSEADGYGELPYADLRTAKDEGGEPKRAQPDRDVAEKKRYESNNEGNGPPKDRPGFGAENVRDYAGHVVTRSSELTWLLGYVLFWAFMDGVIITGALVLLSGTSRAGGVSLANFTAIIVLVSLIIFSTWFFVFRHAHRELVLTPRSVSP
jgi:hypothetical protein